MAAKNKPTKPSDKTTFYAVVFNASATELDFVEYVEIYGDYLDLLFWNPDIDLPIALRNGGQHV